MRVTVLGKYGPYPKAGGGTSSYLLEADGKYILLDAGEGSFSRLYAVIPPEKLSAVVITHYHADHCCDLGVYNYYFESLSRRGISFEKPTLFSLKDDSPLASAALSSPYFRYKEVVGGSAAEVGNVRLVFFDVRHPVPCLGVKVFAEGKVFAYTGDTNVCPALDELFAKSDLVLADGGLLGRDYMPGKPHLSVALIGEYSDKYGVKSIISHFSPVYDPDEISREAAGHSRVVLAEEGKTYGI